MQNNNNGGMKRRPNNMHNGGNGGHRNNNNRPRRFGNNPRQGGEDSGNIARTRRNAQQSRDKYQSMARDAMAMGDRVLGEYYLQHADHYVRVILSLPPEEIRQPREAQRQDQNTPAENTELQTAETGADTEGSYQPSATDIPATALPSFITQSAMPQDHQEHSENNEQ